MQYVHDKPVVYCYPSGKSDVKTTYLRFLFSSFQFRGVFMNSSGKRPRGSIYSSQREALRIL